MPSKDWTGRQDLSDKPNKKNLGPRSKYEPAAAAAPEARPWQIRQLTKEQAPKEQKEQAQTDPAATNNNKKHRLLDIATLALRQRLRNCSFPPLADKKG